MNRLTLEERKKANKIRCKLLYTVDRDIRQSKKNNQKQFLINSMTLQEIEKKFLLFPNYKMKLSTTFTKIANKYMVMKTVDKKTNQNFFYTDYLQDKKKASLRFIKLEKKKASANNIYKIPFLTEAQELQSPMPVIFTNKMNIGEKKLMKPEEKISFSYKKSNMYIECNELDNDNIIKKENKGKYGKNKEKNIINNDDSVNSLTLELLQKKANYLSTSLNNRNKKEIKRRKMQLEAIKKLRQFCFTNLRNKRRCMAKSSHPNLIYVNKKLDEEDEKNNSNNSSSEIIRKGTRKTKKKIINNNDKNNSKNNSKKKNELTSKSKKKKNIVIKNKDKKKLMTSTGKKIFRRGSSKKSPVKLKNINLFNHRKSLVLYDNIITEKLNGNTNNINKIKKKKKDRNDTEKINNSKNGIDEEIVLSRHKNNMKLKKRSTGINGTGILRDSFKEKNNKIVFINQPKIKNKNNIVIINEFNTATKRTCSANDFFKKKNRTKQYNLFSTKNIMKTIKHFKIKEEDENKECRSYKHRRFSIPNKISKKNVNENNAKKEPKSEKSIIIINHIDDSNQLNKKYSHNTEKKEKKICKKFKGRNTQIFNIDKIRIKSEIYKVEEEDIY